MRYWGYSVRLSTMSIRIEAVFPYEAQSSTQYCYRGGSVSNITETCDPENEL